MKALARLVMQGPMQASAVVATAGLLSLLLPPLSLVSGAALALVALARGLRPALRVMAGAAIGALVLGGLLFQEIGAGVTLALVLVTVVWGPMLVVAHSLRRTVSLARAFLLAAIFGALIAIGFHLAQGDPSGWWLQHLREAVAQSGRGEAGPEFDQALQLVSRWMTGAMAASLTLSVIATLMVARWWQAMLYNPGGFAREFRELRLGRALGATTLMLLLVALTTKGAVGMLAADLLVLTGALHLLQGIAVVHGLVARTQASMGWLMGMYVLLVVMPQTGATLAFAGLADNWFDFRAFFGTRENG